ncbi:MAG: hypothetical protein LBN38_04735, partial [Verrucomicrobiota bacterium]|nr:hypothetical protein [Verrucomicrobiota bacterium]
MNLFFRSIFRLLPASALLFCTAGLCGGTGWAAEPPTFDLAMELAGEKQWEASALEFRRLAMLEDLPDKAGSWYWM